MITLPRQAHPDEIQLLVAVVNYKTKLVKPRRGLCSTWLASLDPSNNGLRVPVWVKKGTISFPRALDSPIVMIGPGRHSSHTISYKRLFLSLARWIYIIMHAKKPKPCTTLLEDTRVYLRTVDLKGLPNLCSQIPIVLYDSKSGLEIATNTVANATNFSSLAT